MFKYLVILFLAYTSASYAFIQTNLDNSREVSDIMFLPEEGKFFSNISLERHSLESSTKYLATQSNYYVNDVDTSSLSLEVGKVLAGDMSVAITIPFDLSEKYSTTYGPASTSDGEIEKSEASGLNDIQLDFKWRALNQAIKEINLDVIIELSPKTGSAESGYSGKDGNGFRGGTDFEVGIEVGKKMQNFQFSGEFSIDFNGSRESKDLEDNSITNSDSFTNINLSGTVQFDPNEQFFVNLGFSYLGGFDFDSTSEGTTTNYDVGSSFLIGGAVGYNINKDSAFRLLFASGSVDRDISQGTANFEEEIDTTSFQGTYLIQF